MQRIVHSILALILGTTASLAADDANFLATATKYTCVLHTRGQTDGRVTIAIDVKGGRAKVDYGKGYEDFKFVKRNARGHIVDLGDYEPLYLDLEHRKGHIGGEAISDCTQGTMINTAAPSEGTSSREGPHETSGLSCEDRSTKLRSLIGEYRKSGPWACDDPRYAQMSELYDGIFATLADKPNSCWTHEIYSSVYTILRDEYEQDENDDQRCEFAFVVK